MNQTARRKRHPLRRLFSRLLHRYFLVRRGVTLGVRAVVRSPKGEFLLVRHTYAPGWHFPGGGVEPSHTYTEALASELLEETGLVLMGRPQLHGVFLNTQVSQRDHVLVCLCEAQGRTEARPRTLEIAACAFFDADDLPPDVDRGTARRIREIIDGTDPAPTW